MSGERKKKTVGGTNIHLQHVSECKAEQAEVNKQKQSFVTFELSAVMRSHA